VNQYGRLTGFLLNQPSTEVSVSFADIEDEAKIGISHNGTTGSDSQLVGYAA
jgi:hypothetical protein